MGVLIKNLELPKNCNQCIESMIRFVAQCERCDASYIARSAGRKPDCPLVEEPDEKEGHWKHRKTWTMHICDQCGFENEEATRYCPNCGAKMEDM